jgi:cytochrome c-type biogenesis protein
VCWITGALAVLLGRSVLQVFTGYQLDRWIPGLIGLLMGLQLLGVLNLKMPQLPGFRRARKPGSGWVTPCTVPIFFAIVSFVAFQASVLHGALLMVAYASGRGVILLAVAVSAGLLKALNIGRMSRYVERASGALILAASIGLLLFYEAFVQLTSQWMPLAQ